MVGAPNCSYEKKIGPPKVKEEVAGAEAAGPGEDADGGGGGGVTSISGEEYGVLEESAAGLPISSRFVV